MRSEGATVSGPNFEVVAGSGWYCLLPLVILGNDRTHTQAKCTGQDGLLD